MRLFLRYSWLAAVLLALTLATITVASGQRAAVQPGRSDPVEWAVVPAPDQALGANLSRAGARLPVNPKLDPALVELTTYGRSPAALARAAEAAGLAWFDGRVQVQVAAAPGDPAANDVIESAGGSVTKQAGGLLQAWLPPDQLAAVAADGAIDYIRPPDYAELVEDDLVTAFSQGMLVAGVGVWHSDGLLGQGIKVAIIDGGFQGYSSRLGTELPPNVIVRNFVDNQSDAEVDGTTSHGVACAEIIHDMAPGASLYLLRISTDLDLVQAVNYAISQGVDVISSSLTFLNVSPGDGSGKFAALGQAARDAGILWVTAAGNYRQTHWGGSFLTTDGDDFHEFATGSEVNLFGPSPGSAYQIPPGVTLRASIRWDDWTAVSENYSLLLLRYNGSGYEVVKASNNSQTGQRGQRPTEHITYQTTHSASVYGVAIQRVTSERDVHIELFSPNRILNQRSEDMSIGNLADLSQVLTVAAVDADPAFPQESYSSEGPTNGPGGTACCGSPKPELAAYANVTTASYGPSGFNGTSAATPHVAGAAALVRQAYSNLTPAEAQIVLENRAIDLGAPGRDTDYGFGRLHLGASPWANLSHHVYLPQTLTLP